MPRTAAKRAKSNSGDAATPTAQSTNKRRQVKIAEDADDVLAKCRMLRDSLRKKQMDSDLNDGFSDANDRDTGEFDDDDDDLYFDNDSTDEDVGEKERGYSSRKAKSTSQVLKKTQQIRLSELKKSVSAGIDPAAAQSAGEVAGEIVGKSIVEVVEMNSTEVMEGIENVAVMIARQVLDKQVRFGIASVISRHESLCVSF